MPYKDKKKQNEATHRWYLKNKEKKADYDKKRQQENKDKIAQQKKEYKSTPNGRAASLLAAYNFEDKRNNRGKGDLTSKWIVENIFSKPCAHCGKTGWDVIGCNRLDNSKPHTMDNVEPCCKSCNDKEYGIDSSKTVYQYTINNELVAMWSSLSEIRRLLDYNIGHISACCRGERKTHKGYKWSYEPL
jgi:hypothetical protein